MAMMKGGNTHNQAASGVSKKNWKLNTGITAGNVLFIGGRRVKIYQKSLEVNE